MLTVTTEMRESRGGLDLVWQYAAVPLQELSRAGLLEVFLYQVAGLAKLGGSREWLEDPPQEREQLQSALRAAHQKK